jgi:hypothetical protein
MPELQMCRLSSKGSAENAKEQAMMKPLQNAKYLSALLKIDHTSSIIDLTPGRSAMP